MQRSLRDRTLPRFGTFALLALLTTACDPPPEYDRTPPQIEPTVPRNDTGQCAPTAVRQTTSGNSVFYLYTAQKTWTAAKADCEAMGGRLGVPTSSTVNTALKNINGNAASFIGVYQTNYQSSPSANWVNIEGVSQSYFNWGSGEPNDQQGTENNEENCGVLRADGMWNDLGCTNTRQYFCEFASAPVACGGGSSCSIPSGASTYSCQCPSGKSYDADSNSCFGGPLSIQVTSLDTDHPMGSTAFVNFPIHVKLGLKGTGNTNNIQVTLGLMERPASGASATQTEVDALRSCQIGGDKITLKGDGTQQYLEFDGIVPPECLGTDSQRVYNYYVLLDGVDEVSSEEDKFRVYSELQQSTTLSQQCVSTDAAGGTHPGCVHNITVRPSPGVDVALISSVPVSSVIVLDPSGQHARVPSGQTEAPRPLITTNTTIAAFGRDFDDTNAANLPSGVQFRYDIIAVPDTTGVGWKPLNVNPDAGSASLSTLSPGEQLQLEGRLHPSPDFRTLTSPGGPWAGVPDYKIRACVGPMFPEHGDPIGGGMNGLNNNCKEFTVRLVFGDFSSSSASTEENTKTISETYGSSSSIALGLSGGSTNKFSLTGASSTNSAKATLSGFFGSFTMFEGWGNGAASVSPVQGTLDYGLKVFGVSMLGDPPGSASSVTYTKTYGISKEKCVTYSYGIVIVSVDLSGCFSASAGVALDLYASGTQVRATVRPYVSAGLSVSATLNATIYRASLTGSVTVLGLNTTAGDGVSATLSYVVNSTSPVKLTVGLTISAKFVISTLSGSLSLSLEQLELQWCKKKVWGVKISYPCGWDYDTVAEYTLFSYSGYSYTNNLLNRTASNIVLQ